MNKEQLRRKIAALDFAIWELHLFLDTHPDEQAAIQKRDALLAERRQLIHVYEAQFGTYPVESGRIQGQTWSWLNDPWPWDVEGGNGYVAV